VRQRAEKIAKTNVSILICGDGGTGKEALARWIHANSTYSTGEFVKVNCAAIPGELLESELFGYEKGAFTGAHSAKPGRVELAHNGTLFLDEIADLDMSLQSKLLHFLQDSSFSRLGDHCQRTVDTRLLCATNRNLDELIQSGHFRADLFYRINVFRLELPKLQERREDIPVLVEFFRVHHQKQFGKSCEPLTAEMVDYFRNRSWPGNIRELSNGVARYVLMGAEQPLPRGGNEKPRGIVVQSGKTTKIAAAQLKGLAKDAIREMERHVIADALHEHHWNRRKAAEALKISYRTLIYKIRDAGLIPGRPTSGAPISKSSGSRPKGQGTPLGN